MRLKPEIGAASEKQLFEVKSSENYCGIYSPDSQASLGKLFSLLTSEGKKDLQSKALPWAGKGFKKQRSLFGGKKREEEKGIGVTPPIKEKLAQETTCPQLNKSRRRRGNASRDEKREYSGNKKNVF